MISLLTAEHHNKSIYSQWAGSKSIPVIFPLFPDLINWQYGGLESDQY